MSADVELVHVETGIHAVVPEKVVPGWERMGYVRLDDAHDDRRRTGAAVSKRPALSPGISDDSTAGSSSTTTE